MRDDLRISNVFTYVYVNDKEDRRGQMLAKEMRLPEMLPHDRLDMPLQIWPNISHRAFVPTLGQWTYRLDSTPVAAEDFDQVVVEAMRWGFVAVETDKMHK